MLTSITNIRLYTGKDYFRNGMVVVDGDHIVYSGEKTDIPENSVNVDGHNGICIPGLCNTHTHSAMVYLRGLGSDLSLYDWLGKVCPVEMTIDEEMMYHASSLAIAEMISTGTTCFADQYMKMDSIVRAVRDSGIRACLCRGSDSVEGVLSDADRFRTCSTDMIHIYFGLHSEYLSSEDAIEKAISMASEYGTGLHIHMSETEREVSECMSRHGKTPIEFFADKGVFGCPVIAAHCVHTTEHDRELMKNGNFTVAHCPSSNLKLASGISPVAEYSENGINVSIGTDGAASNNSMDMFREMRLASLLQKGVTKRADAVDAGTVFTMATVNGARAMGFPDVGTLEAGKKADLVILNGISLLESHDDLANIVFTADGSCVTDTMINGRFVYRNREFTTIDIERSASYLRLL